MRSCCICGKEIYIGYNYLCKSCWKEWKNYINSPWLRALISFEQKDRDYDKNYPQTSIEELQEIDYNE